MISNFQIRYWHRNSQGRCLFEKASPVFRHAQQFQPHFPYKISHVPHNERVQNPVGATCKTANVRFHSLRDWEQVSNAKLNRLRTTVSGHPGDVNG